MFIEFDLTTSGNGFTPTEVNPTQPSPTILGLPSFHTEIPVILGSAVEDDSIIFATRLVNTGIIGRDDIDPSRSLQQTIQHCINKHLNSRVGNFFGFDLTCDCMTTNAAQYSELSEAMEDDNDGKQRIGVEFALDNVPDIRVEKAIQSLNSIHPDLGESIYAILDQRSTYNVPIYTFTSMISLKEWSLGYNSEDEFDGEPEEDEPVERKMHEIIELMQQFPFDWVVNPQQKLTSLEISEFIEKTDNTLIIRVLEAAIALLKFDDEHSHFGHLALEGVNAQAIVKFAEHDPTEELMDEFFNATRGCEDSFTESIHQGVIDISTDDEFISSWNNLTEGLRYFHATNQFLHALHELNEGTQHD